MINAKSFERNFMTHYKSDLDKLGVDVVRLHSSTNADEYRAIELLTKPLDEESVSLGYLRSHSIAQKYQLTFAVENFGRGEGEKDLKKSFSIKICDYKNEDEILNAAKRLHSAEREFYGD